MTVLAPQRPAMAIDLSHRWERKQIARVQNVSVLPVAAGNVLHLSVEILRQGFGNRPGHVASRAIFGADRGCGAADVPDDDGRRHGGDDDASEMPRPVTVLSPTWCGLPSV